MRYDVAGIGNALIDALVILEDDESLIRELGLNRGTFHPVDHAQWQRVYERVRVGHTVTFDSGGSCANTIGTLGHLGLRTLYCGQVGNDQMGQMYAARLEEACGAHALQFSADMPTGKCLSIIGARDAERTMLTDLGAATSLPGLGAFADAIGRTRVAHFTGYTLLADAMRVVVMEAMGRAQAGGAVVSLDAADPFVVGTLRPVLWEVLERFVDVAFLNSEEARMLAQEEPDRAVRTIAERGKLTSVVVKLGSQGSLVWHAGEVHRVGIRKVKAVDTTGAGDAYAAGFLYGVVQGWEPERCGALGASIAAAAVSQVGAVVKDRAALAALVRAVAPAPAGVPG